MISINKTEKGGKKEEEKGAMEEKKGKRNSRNRSS